VYKVDAIVLNLPHFDDVEPAIKKIRTAVNKHILQRILNNMPTFSMTFETVTDLLDRQWYRFSFKNPAKDEIDFLKKLDSKKIQELTVFIGMVVEETVDLQIYSKSTTVPL
jgi:hypothetical protein